VRFSGKLGLKLLEASLEGLIQGLLKCISAERLGMFIENNWTILESIFYNLNRVPTDAYAKLTPKEVAMAERIRRGMTRTVLPVLGMARTVASKFPPSAVESKVTPDWLLEKGRKRFPELVAVIEKHGERGRRWLRNQAIEIREYLTGKIVFDPEKGKMVNVTEYMRKYKKME